MISYHMCGKGVIMARAKKLLRTNVFIPFFGECMIEVKEDRLRLHDRNTGRIHHWSWEHLLSECQCIHCMADKEDKSNISII